MFKLHDQLAKDCIHVGDLDLCQILLMNDQRYPWLILVPKRENMRDLHNISPADQSLMFNEINIISKVLETLYAPDKINVAALGNMVPQLHIHIIARFKSDDAWPAPIWGKHPAKKYNQEQIDNLLLQIQAQLPS